MQLQRKLFVGISVLTILPLLLLQFGVVGRSEKILEERVTQKIHDGLDKLAAELETLLGAQKAMVKGLAAVPAVQSFARTLALPGESEEYQQRASDLGEFFLNYQAAVPSIQALRIMDVQGNTLVKIKESKIVEPKARLDDGRGYVAYQGQKPFFQRIALHLERGTVGISDFELGQVAPDAKFCPSMIRYLTPLYDAGEKMAFLVVNMWGRHIDDLIDATLGGYNGRVLMAELSPLDPARDGIYLYHPDGEKRFANQTGSAHRLSENLGPELWRQITDSEEQGSVVSGDQAVFYHKFRPYPDRGNVWLLALQGSRAEFLAPILQMRYGIWALVAALSVLGLVLARWLALRMAAPVRHLTDLITRYTNGENVRYADKRQDEIGRMGRAFNHLTDSLTQVEKIGRRQRPSPARPRKCLPSVSLRQVSRTRSTIRSTI